MLAQVAHGLVRPWAVVSAVAVVALAYSGQGEPLLQLPFEVAKEEYSVSALGHVPQPDGSWMELSQEHLAEAKVARAVDLRIQ